MNHLYAYSPHIWPSIITLLLLPTLAAYAWRHRSVPGALPFVYGTLFAALWAAGSVMEYAAVDVATKIFWVKFQAVWQLPTVTAITCFALEYTWPGRWQTRRNLVLLSIAPLLLLVFTLTNDLHHLMWTGFRFDGSVVPLRGPGIWLSIFYGYGLGIINIVALVWLFVHSPQHRWPVVIMLLGMVGSRTIYMLEKVNIVQYELPLDLLVIALMNLIYVIALFGFRLFDPLPLARQAAIEQLHDGMLVVDPQGRVASLNPAARAILGVTEKHSLGQPIQDLLPACEGLAGKLQAAGTSQTEIRLGTGPETRDYILGTSVLMDWRGMEAGHLLLLRDVTREKRAQAQIIEQQRALAMLKERDQLARELHDSLGQMVAFVSTQGQTIRRLLDRGEIAAADEFVCRLVEVAREADVDIRESIQGLHGISLDHGFLSALSHYLAQFEKNTAIHTDLIRPAAFEDGCLDSPVEVQLLRILQEALTNVRKHAGARNVEIKFEAGQGWVNVTVRDDGLGFDPVESVDGSGRHIGLRVMRERASFGGRQSQFAFRSWAGDTGSGAGAAGGRTP